MSDLLQSHLGSAFRRMQGECREVEATVFAVLPEFNQARAQGPDGFQYAITRHTRGVNVAELEDGQRLLCTVMDHPVRVTSAYRAIDVTVCAVLPEFHQARAQAADGFQYAITWATIGVKVTELEEGQHLVCIVTQHPARVLRALRTVA